jgi:hypothetical protein
MACACSIAGIRMTAALRDTVIMLIPMMAVLALVITWLAMVLLIPSFATPELMRWILDGPKDRS